MSDQVRELIEKTEKTIMILKDSEAKALKKKTDSETKIAELAKSMEALLKEKEVKEKRQKDLSEKEIPKAMEVLKQAEMQLEARQAKKSEKGLSPEQTVTVENSINEATDKTTRATVMMSALEKEAKAIADSLKSTHLQPRS